MSRQNRRPRKAALAALSLALALSLMPAASFAEEADGGGALSEGPAAGQVVEAPAGQGAESPSAPSADPLGGQGAEPLAGQGENQLGEPVAEPLAAPGADPLAGPPVQPLASGTWTGSGTLASPYVISDAPGLALLADRVNAGNSYQNTYFSLGADVALQGPWTPIGSQAALFSGSFDGGGKTVSGLSVDMTGAGDVVAGLFGAIGAPARISNLSVEGSVRAESTAGSVFVGIAVGSAQRGSSLAKVTAAGDVAGTAAENAYLGGAVGLSGAMSEVASTLSKPIVGQAYRKCSVGGLAGEAYGAVTNSKATLAGIEGQSDVGAASLGGLIGYSSQIVTGCEVDNAGGISGSSDNNCAIGGMIGVVGLFMGSIASCDVVTHGSLSAQSGSLGNAGGAVGIVLVYTTMLQQLHATTFGSIEVTAPASRGQANAGGLAGFAQSNIQECGSFVQGSVHANGAMSAYAGGAFGLSGPVSKVAGWVGGSILAEGADAAAGGYAGAFVVSAIQQVAMDVAGDVRANGVASAYAAGIVGYISMSTALKDVSAKVGGAVEALDAAECYAGGIVSKLPSKSGTSSYLLAEVQGPIGTGSATNGAAGGLAGLVDNQGPGLKVTDSVALFNDAEGSAAHRVGEANIDPQTSADPLDNNYALRTARANGAPVDDAAKGPKTREGADWPNANATWADVFDNANGAWTLNGDDAPHLKIAETTAAKLGRGISKFSLLSVDPGVANGTVELSPHSLAREGSAVSATPKPDAGYRLVAGSLAYRPAAGGAPVAITGASFDAPPFDAVVTASFERTYDATADPAMANGTVELSPAGPHLAGAAVSATPKPAPGYRTVAGSLAYRPAAGGASVAIAGASFAMPAFDVVVSARFEKVPVYSATADPAMANGTLELSPPALEEGAAVAVTPKPAPGYRLVAGSLAYRPAAGGDPVAIEGASFRMPAFDVVVSARFEKVPPAPGPGPDPQSPGGRRLAATGGAGAGAGALASLAALAAGGLVLALRRRA